MLCNICNKNQASVHLTEIVDNHMSELHLCEDCARKKSMQMEQQFGLSDLLAGLVDYGKQIGGSEKEATLMRCEHCGLTYEDFRKIGRFGCSECYSAFEKYLGPLLKRIHGASQHVGKSPLGGGAQEVPRGVKVKPDGVDVPGLKARLQQAIEHEEFEEAARLRDMIKDLECRLKNESEKKKRGSLKKDDTQ